MPVGQRSLSTKSKPVVKAPSSPQVGNSLALQISDRQGPNGLPTRTTEEPPTDLQRRRRRRRRCVCLLATIGALLLVGVTLLVLFLTVLRVRDPTTRLVSARLIGLEPSLSRPNFTVLMTVSVHNPNVAAFSYESGSAQLWYRGAYVGEAAIDPGSLPSRGDGTMQMETTVLMADLAANLTELIKDFMAGFIPLDASARVPGKVPILGAFKLSVVAFSDCHMVLGVQDMDIRYQECHDHIKL